ncbi:MAG: hypothetical protein HN416_11045 [Nitrospina sp.]|jgi:hypothetical protein|nr:hypothetical protein [Nitrospina sp.]
MDNWFIPSKEEFPFQRSMLHLGLNKAVRYYRELVVPGIGGVWFVRQLCWAVAGIKLSEKSRLGQSVSIANAIEALACKLMWKQNDETGGIKGKMAFGKYPDTWGFKELSQSKYYVQVRFRQSTVRALLGLGLTQGGFRFNGMELTSQGEDLANAFLSQNWVGKKLLEWLDGKTIPKTGKIVKGLGRYDATADEKEIVRNRLCTDVYDEIGLPSRRKNLIRVLKNRKNMPALKNIKEKLLLEKQVQEIETAEAFDAMLCKAQNLIHECARELESAQTSSIDILAKKLPKSILELKGLAGEYLEMAQECGKSHPDAKNFAQEVQESDREIILLEKVALRDGSIVAFSDGKILQGPLFDRHKQIASCSSEQNNGEDEKEVASEESSTTRKIEQLFSLWRDCYEGKH